MISILTIVLAFAGLINSFYFTFAYYGRVKRARWIPEILCAREGSSCVTVVQTPYARVFGPPNSLLGIVYYALLIVWAVGFRWRWWVVGFNELLVYLSLKALLLIVSLIAVALGFYLVYALRRKLHTDCPLCYTAHAINLALLVLLLLL